MLSISPCFNTPKLMYKNVMEGLCPSLILNCMCTFFLALAQTISFPAWELFINPVRSHCNLESLQEPDYIELMHGLTPTSTHTTIPHLHWQFVPNQTIADWGVHLERRRRKGTVQTLTRLHYLVCRCINEACLKSQVGQESLAHVSKQSSWVWVEMLVMFIPA